MQNKKKITHRCKELLEYNQKSFKPCSIRYGIWLPYDNPSWLLCSLETNDEDWNIKFMHPMIKNIKYCPFCAKELDTISVQVIEPTGVKDGNRTDN